MLPRTCQRSSFVFQTPYSKSIFGTSLPPWLLARNTDPGTCYTCQRNRKQKRALHSGADCLVASTFFTMPFTYTNPQNHFKLRTYPRTHRYTYIHATAASLPRAGKKNSSVELPPRPSPPTPCSHRKSAVQVRLVSHPPQGVLVRRCLCHRRRFRGQRRPRHPPAPTRTYAAAPLAAAFSFLSRTPPFRRSASWLSPLPPISPASAVCPPPYLPLLELGTLSVAQYGGDAAEAEKPTNVHHAARFRVGRNGGIGCGGCGWRSGLCCCWCWCCCCC